jgi:thioredoxin reductase (NADPH)
LAATVKVSKIDVYKNSSLAARLGTIEAPSLVYTKVGEIVAKDKNISKESIMNVLSNL